MGKLLENNSIEDISLVDKNDDQLKHASEILKKYDNSRSDKEYAKALGYEEMNYIPSIHKLRPKIDGNDVTMHLVPGRIEKYLDERIKTKDTYFLYFSNALFSIGWTNDNDSFKILEGMLHNDNIDYGSVIFIAKVSQYDALVLQKRDGKFVPLDGGVPSEWHYVLSSKYNSGIIALQ